MKTKRFVGIELVIGLLLVLTGDALAFYNPQTGRWLSRDPIGEEGFNPVETSRKNVESDVEASIIRSLHNRGKWHFTAHEFLNFREAEQSVSSTEISVYQFTGNDAVNTADFLGLWTVPFLHGCPNSKCREAYLCVGGFRTERRFPRSPLLLIGCLQSAINLMNQGCIFSSYSRFRGGCDLATVCFESFWN